MINRKDKIPFNIQYNSIILIVLIFMFCSTDLFAEKSISNILRGVKNQISGIENYEADMIITYQFAPFQKREVIKKAHVYYSNGNFRVEMLIPETNIYLFKGNKKYKLNKQNKKFEKAKFIMPDFLNHEPLGSIKHTINNLGFIREKKLNTKKNSFVLSYKTILSTLVLRIRKKSYTIDKITTYTDSQKHTETTLEYKKIRSHFFLIKKTYNDFNNKISPNLTVKLENVKTYGQLGRSLFYVN
jgi:hypothetical protein